MDNFTQKYNEHFAYVYRYLRFRLGDAQAAEDVTSKTFLTAFEHRKQYEPEKGSWKQWITGLAKHVLLNHWKREKIPLSLEEVGQVESLLYSHHETGEKLDRKLLMEAILDSMPPNVCRLFILRYMDDLTYEEIAESTGKTPAAVRKFFSRLHKSLNKKFGHYDLTF